MTKKANWCQISFSTLKVKHSPDYLLLLGHTEIQPKLSVLETNWLEWEGVGSWLEMSLKKKKKNIYIVLIPQTAIIPLYYSVYISLERQSMLHGQKLYE